MNPPRVAQTMLKLTTFSVGMPGFAQSWNQWDIQKASLDTSTELNELRSNLYDVGSPIRLVFHKCY